MGFKTAALDGSARVGSALCRGHWTVLDNLDCYQNIIVGIFRKLFKVIMEDITDTVRSYRWKELPLLYRIFKVRAEVANLTSYVLSHPIKVCSHGSSAVNASGSLSWPLHYQCQLLQTVTTVYYKEYIDI